MDFWIEFTNKMFWFVAPLVLAMPFTLMIFFIWGSNAAGVFAYSVWGLVCLYAVFCIFMEIRGKPGRRWMSSDPLVDWIAKRLA